MDFHAIVSLRILMYLCTCVGSMLTLLLMTDSMDFGPLKFP